MQPRSTPLPLKTRRDCLRLGVASLGAAFLDTAALAESRVQPPVSNADRSLILLVLTGGPSQLETFDPKPNAPTEIRGPFASIETAVPGVRIVEHLPRIARRLDRLTLVRSLFHDESPIHETGLQLLQSGRIARLDESVPSLGHRVASALGNPTAAPRFAVLPGPIGHLGVSISRGQDKAASSTSPAFMTPEQALSHRSSLLRARETFGTSDFALGCAAAAELVGRGTRVAVVNAATTVFNAPSWDAHGAEPFSTLQTYCDQLLPEFDRAFSALVDTLETSGRLDSTLVVAVGEFGRTPHLNPQGGRDHWTRAWSGLIAGGGVAGGRVIGATDSQGGEPVDEPFPLHHLTAQMAWHLGLESSEESAQSISSADTVRPSLWS